jgi:hypothetical protein
MLHSFTSLNRPWVQSSTPQKRKENMSSSIRAYIIIGNNCFLGEVTTVEKK